jgi:uncharacterized delta-60 repeat protein
MGGVGGNAGLSMLQRRRTWLLGFALAVVLAPAAACSGSSDEESSPFPASEGFGGDGMVSTDFGGDDRAAAVAVQSDGRIVVAGEQSFAGTDGPVRFALARYLSDGRLDPSFGRPGKVVTSPSRSSRAETVALQGDGKIVAGGSTLDWFGRPAGYSVRVRYTADGRVDRSFGVGGKILTRLDPHRSTGRHPAGEVGFVRSPGRTLALGRYLADGSPDPTFGTGGKVLTDLWFRAASAVAVGDDGAIAVLGETYARDFAERDVVLERYTAAGRPESRFGRNGKVVTALAAGSHVALAIQPDGKTIAAGSRRGAFAVLRYTADGRLDTPVP